MCIKFLFDRTFAFIGIILFSPLYILLSLIIFLSMPDGSPIFVQRRVGRQGKTFKMYKFRTMHKHHNGSSVSVKGESRITPLGAFLRKWKLDELPELWNVWIGDMSFVGPRPDVPGYADLLEGENRKILLLRPGITGPASLKYRNEEELLANQENPQKYNDEVIFPDKVRINLHYYYHQSFALDIKIIIFTLLGKELKENC
ncbi:MAG: sugar transferase [Bacteroidales bacterium]|jgi:lipopolysaccharide/colanic/teichoic acid biosynthesis glycosyltransferase|nr:sugar transferase [Bacteroidales bacterium]MDD2688361.1 sugar transferase [Bacteroidales bacterium]MDD3330558.1 sugar transferase [Bacteroidales bacterium]MDD3691483.1 sugar transferase [Bacteroidales bacterium]MDD4581635.1 sugar transferase [Bacteroidales bacterium]